MNIERKSGVLSHIVLSFGGLIMLYPLFYMFLAALMDPYEYILSATLLPIPSDWNFGIFWEMLSYKDIPYWFRNTILRITWYLAWTILTAIVLGYFFSKGKFFGKTVMFYVLLSTMMIPNITALVPTYIMYARWPWAGGNDVFFGGSGLLNTWPVMLVGGLVQVFAVFLVKQMYDTLPNEYEEAARIDGAGTYRIIFQIYAPMLKSVMAVIVIGTFGTIWNDFLTNLVFTDGSTGPHLTMVAYGVTKLTSLVGAELIENQYIVNYPGVFAAALLVTLPSIVTYLVLQKHMVMGLAMSGLKG